MITSSQPAATLPDPFLALPKVLLHEHLDGGLRPATLLALAHARGLDVPTDDPAALAAWMQANADSGSLERYLQGFALTVGAMASAEGCERVAYEAAEDARLDGCVLAEFRIAPLLFEPLGLPFDAVVEALVSGLRKSALPAGLIVCAMRTEPPHETLRAATLAARHAGRGVIGFDLAGAERGFPPTPHAAAFQRAAEAGLGLTCHAGESDLGSRVLEAADLGATRIGHGVHIMDGSSVGGYAGGSVSGSAGGSVGRSVGGSVSGSAGGSFGILAGESRRQVDAARARGLHFEVCPTSNVHTGAFASLADHPIRKMVESDLSVSCSTDNRLMSGVTQSGEFAAIHRALGVDLAMAAQMMRAAAEASFMPAADRQAALATLQRWAEGG